jgi:integrase
MPDKINSHESVYLIKFEKLPTTSFKELAKKYIKNKLIRTSMRNCIDHLRDITSFCLFINKKYNFYDLEKLERHHVESFLEYHYKETHNKNSLKYARIVNIKSFIEYIDKAGYKGSPEVPYHKLIFSSDIPLYSALKKPHEKFIPEDVLEQIDANISKLPDEYIPIVVLLRISGWRISDILNLKYRECLIKQKDGYYLQGDIKKTKVFGHKIPISDEMGLMVEQLIKEVKRKSNYKNNPDGFLFPILEGHRIGKPILGQTINTALNKLCRENDIKNSKGDIFSCTNHAFRHTKAVELINNGMNLLHVQKWLAHAAPKMTLHYAKILDTTMRKSWEEAMKDGMFKLDGAGRASKVDLSNVQDEDIIEWEWIKHNLDAVRMPLGYCMKPNKMECATQLNPCLTCRSLCTTPEFIPAFEQEIYQTKDIINKGKSQNRTFWVEKNELLLNKLESVLSVLKDGKIKHDAGKQGREYVGEQRK